MNYKELAEEFIKQHEGIGYQSLAQIVAVRAFAEWLESKSGQRGVQFGDATHTPKTELTITDDRIYSENATGATPRRR
jgi:hypothetical protein